MTNPISTRRPVVSHSASPRVVRHPVGSWSEFVGIIQGWQGFRNWCFRGQGDERWELKSSLTRHIEVANVCEATWERQETRIARIFRRKSHLFLEALPKDDQLEWLALMQHHGAPTRLLDFTWSPYVAAFFALERASSNAAVWALNLPLLWDIHARRKIDGVQVTKAHPKEEAMLATYYRPNSHSFVWQGDPFRMPQRVVAQSGTFLVTSNLGKSVEEILADYPGKGELLIQFVFDTAKMRTEAMAALYSMNITQATLFPGLDGLARSMAYEFEYSWEVDLATSLPLESLQDPRLPTSVLSQTPMANSPSARAEVVSRRRKAASAAGNRRTG
jgi:FRG domain-containing protein